MRRLYVASVRCTYKPRLTLTSTSFISQTGYYPQSRSTWVQPDLFGEPLVEGQPVEKRQDAQQNQGKWNEDSDQFIASWFPYRALHGVVVAFGVRI